MWAPPGFVESEIGVVFGVTGVAFIRDFRASEPWCESVVRPLDQRCLSHTPCCTHIEIESGERGPNLAQERQIAAGNLLSEAVDQR